MIKIENKTDCCGCSACVQRCPKQCISLHEDAEGFLYPRVDESHCIDCGLCEKVCPLLHPSSATSPVRIVAARNRDEEVRMSSSSGGVFHALAERTVGRGGVVFGAVFDAAFRVRFTYAESREAVSPMMGSKYAQAEVGTAFSDAERFLKAGREVLFVGAPCQIAGLRRFLRKDYPNLLAVDFICHGTPSPGVWRSYLKNDVDADSTHLRSITFRDKQRSGWKRFHLLIHGVDGRPLVADPFPVNPYMRGFLQDVYLRPSCHECRCKGGTSGSDLTMGDFWGIEQCMPDFDDDKGTSLIVVSTSRGRTAFESLPLEVRPCAAEQAFSANPAYCRSVDPHPRRALFYELWGGGMRVTDALQPVLRVTRTQCAMNFLKRVEAGLWRRMKRLTGGR